MTLEKGYSINYKSAMNPKTKEYTIEIEGKTKKGKWEPLRQFLEENIEESLHTLIQWNVMAATQFFNQRVKAFITNIV